MTPPLTVEQAAPLLGTTPKVLRRKLREGAIPRALYCRPFKKYLFTEDQIERILRLNERNQ